MSRITQWLKKRRTQKMYRYMAKVRIGSLAEKEAFLKECITDAYAPLYFAMITLECRNFVEGTIQEQTTGEWYKVEMRRIDNPELLKP